jgi:hypothetical protein
MIWMKLILVLSSDCLVLSCCQSLRRLCPNPNPNPSPSPSPNPNPRQDNPSWARQHQECRVRVGGYIVQQPNRTNCTRYMMVWMKLIYLCVCCLVIVLFCLVLSCCHSLRRLCPNPNPNPNPNPSPSPNPMSRVGACLVLASFL